MLAVLQVDSLLIHLSFLVPGWYGVKAAVTIILMRTCQNDFQCENLLEHYKTFIFVERNLQEAQKWTEMTLLVQHEDENIFEVWVIGDGESDYANGFGLVSQRDGNELAWCPISPRVTECPELAAMLRDGEC